MRAALRPLRLPGFPSLGAAYLVNELGNWLGEIALAVLVFDRTESALATAALFLAMQFMPALLAPPLTAALERLPARVSLPGLYAGEALAFAGLALLAGEFVLAGVIAIALLDGALASAARALTRASAAAVLTPEGLLREGNALLNFAFTAGAAAGPALAGLVVAGAGVELALATDAASFFAIAALLAATRSLPQPDTELRERGWALRLRRGIAYVARHVALRRIFAAQGAAFVFFALVIPIEVVFAKQTLGAGDAGYGALLASWGGGMVVGSVVFASLRRVSLVVLIAVSTLAIGLAYLGTAAAPTLLVACLASAVGGTGNGVQWIALVTEIQILTRAAYQARVLALLEAMASAMPGIGFLLGGAVTALVNPRASYAVAGAGVLVVLAVAALALRRTGLTAEAAAPDASSLAAQAAEPAGATEPG